MSMVIAVREGDEGGSFFGFQEDRELLECSECADNAAYRLRYTLDQRSSLKEHRFKALEIISDEHPDHADRIRIA